MKKRFLQGLLIFCLFSALSYGISANAADLASIYTDASRIEYQEAVEVLTAIEIMRGYSDGRFRPDGYLTRGAAAKIIANLSITPEEVRRNYQVYEKVQTASPFVDVPKTNVFSNYITYCSQQNLVSGYGDHTFQPGGLVTYNAFLKMLLCVLGHDQYAEGYTGGNWRTRVLEDAQKSGLLSGFPGVFYESRGNESIPREVAALFAFNALLANQVHSSDGVVTPRVVASSQDRYKNIRNATARSTDSQLVQFGEARFPDLRRTVNPNGEVIWRYKQLSNETGERIEWNSASYPDNSEFRSYNVLLDRNDGDDTASYDMIVVTNGNIYGNLPILTSNMRNMRFEGWFTQAYDGEQITRESPVWLDRNNTVLYAHWTSGRPYAYFNPSGGLVGDARESMEIPLNGILNNLPRPSRVGYEFDGWYTEEGERIQNGDSVSPSSSVTLHARWSPLQPRVTFLAAGMNVDPPRKTVTYGQMYGALPTLGPRNGVPFVGWYTDSDASGDKIEETTPVQETVDHTLYAHWSLGTDASARALTFRVEGFIHRRILIRPGAQLTEWPPAPEKENFQFNGWVESVSGEVPDLPLTVSSDMLFVADYSVLQTCIVTFHADGASVVNLPEPMSVEPGKQLSEEDLPTLTPSEDDAHRFLGWASDGARISFPLTLQSNLDLYAIWTERVDSTDFAYPFTNSAESFGEHGEINREKLLARFGLLFGNPRLAKELFSSYCINNGYAWRGNCFGMSTTAGMFQHPGNSISVSDFVGSDPSVTRPGHIHALTDEYRNDLWDGLTLQEFIETMQISQNTITFLRAHWENLDSLDGLCKEVSRFSETDSGAVVICIYERDDGAGKAHALLGYYLEEHETYSYLYVYDCNFPDREPYILLTKDENGNYTQWLYKDAREYATKVQDVKSGEAEGLPELGWGSEYGGKITFIPYETYYFIWQRRGNQDVSMNFLSTNLTDLTIYDSDGNRVASFRDGQIENPEDVRRNGVYPLVDLDDNPDGEPRPVAVWLPDASEYRIENDSPYSMQQEISLSNAERSVTVRTMARVVTLSVDKAGDRQTTDDASQTNIVLHAAIDGRDENAEIQADGVHLPASDLDDSSIVWSGAVRSNMELTCHISDNVLKFLETAGVEETQRLLVNGQDMTESLKNALNHAIRFDDAKNMSD